MKNSDRTVNWLLVVISIVTAVTLVLGAFGLKEITTGNTAIEAQRRSDKITSCRAAARARIDDAIVELLLAQAASDDLICRGFAAAALNDRELLLNIGEAASDASDRIERATEHVTEATDEYTNALQLSRDDPDKFLEQCPDTRLPTPRLPTTSTTLRSPTSKTSLGDN